MLLQALFLFWSHFQVVIEYDGLPVEHEVAEPGIAVQNIEQFIDSMHQAQTELLKCLIPLTVPVCVGNNDDIELLGHDTSLVESERKVEDKK